MSGPKDYTPPPRYSLQVFDGKLNKIFQLQHQLNTLCNEINALNVNDSKLKINFDCKEEIKKLKSSIAQASKSLILDYKGTFDQDTYNKIESSVQNKIDKISDEINKCNIIKRDFNNKENDYNAYCSFLNYYDNSKVTFNDFKNRVINYYKNEINTESPEIFIETEQKISSINIDKKIPVFSFNFREKNNSERESLTDNIISKEEQVNNIRNEINDKLIRKYSLNSSAISLLSLNTDIVSDEINRVIDKIDMLFRACEDPLLVIDYKNKLDKLKQSKSLNEIYYYKELHDQILGSEKNRKNKIEINSVLLKLNKVTIHKNLYSEKQKLINLCLNLINQSSLTKKQVLDTFEEYDGLLKDNLILFEEEEIIKKERLFLKSQIVHSLENFGYEVMDDLEVIDFEKGDDFLLKIAGQDNYLNLKFKEDGSMRYAFKIPEKKEDLSTDQENVKLHEMKVTCNEFKSVLSDLSKMGLNINLRSEKQIELKSIVSLTDTDKLKAKLKAKSITQQQQLRKKYLN